MLEVERNENIHLLTYSEVQKVTGFVGNFDVEVLVKPRYTTKDCNGCGACVEVCPAYASSEFNQNLIYRKAIYISFTQAVPMVAQIDIDKCIKCGLCEKVCELEAIDFDQEPKIEKFKVGTIVVATGWDEFRPNDGYLGYGVYKNVITQLELERILAPNGPTYGHLIRPSDGKTPKNILFVQCVGSRDLKRNRHCSSGVCCMTSIKNTKLIKQHDASIDVSVAFIDIRASGKGYEEYFLEARKYGVKFRKASIPRIREDQKTKNLKVYMADMLNDNMKMEEEEYDLVVLSSAMQPANNINKLNEVLKLETSQDGFFKEFHSRLSPIDTSQVGISLAGAAQGPKSIAETIMQAKGAASSAGVIMMPGEYTMVMIKAVVDKERCSKCYLCINNCPYSAITMTDNGTEVDEVKCRGCGMCAMSCPSQAITVRNSRDIQFNALIDNLLYRSVLEEVE
ncbi:MAG: 4Fe-4S binding protein [Promethearchaeota archaeon]